MKYAPKCEEKWCRKCEQQCKVRNLPTSGKIAHILYNEQILQSSLYRTFTVGLFIDKGTSTNYVTLQREGGQRFVTNVRTQGFVRFFVTRGRGGLNSRKIALRNMWTSPKTPPLFESIISSGSYILFLTLFQF